MEKLAVAVLPVLMAVVLVRLLLMPMRLTCKLALHTGGGFLCLWLINLVAPFTGVLLPMNAVTALTAGFLGLPGIGLLALLEML